MPDTNGSLSLNYWGGTPTAERNLPNLPESGHVSGRVALLRTAALPVRERSLLHDARGCRTRRNVRLELLQAPVGNGVAKIRSAYSGLLFIRRRTFSLQNPG